MKFTRATASTLTLLTVAILSVWQPANHADHHSGEPGAWTTLFDGTTTDAWRLYNGDAFPDEGWVVEDNNLVFRPRADGQAIGDIITRDVYRDFELRLEWMVEEGGNSGILYHILEQPDKAIYWSGLEMQVLDDVNHPDSFLGVNGNRQAGSLYDLLPIEPKTARPFGEWNEVRIISNGTHVEHWLNGEKVLAYERWTVDWFAMLRASKFREHNEFGAMQQGHIGLQDHGDVVRYRNIRIREL